MLKLFLLNKNIEIVEEKIDWRLREGVPFLFFGKGEPRTTPEKARSRLYRRYLDLATKRHRHRFTSCSLASWLADRVCARRRQGRPVLQRKCNLQISDSFVLQKDEGRGWRRRSRACRRAALYFRGSSMGRTHWHTERILPDSESSLISSQAD